jgi:hypothetical protein
MFTISWLRGSISVFLNLNNIPGVRRKAIYYTTHLIDYFPIIRWCITIINGNLRNNVFVVLRILRL